MVRTDCGRISARECVLACVLPCLVPERRSAHMQRGQRARWGPRRAAHGENGRMQFSTWEGGGHIGKSTDPEELGGLSFGHAKEEVGVVLGLLLDPLG
jgi:hypothetical protein